MSSCASEPAIAGLGVRVCAFLIDMAVFFASFFASGVVVVVCGAVAEPAVRVVWPVSLAAVLAFAVWNLGIRQGGVRAASFGKSAMNLRLVDADSLAPVGRGRGVLRCVLRPVDIFSRSGYYTRWPMWRTGPWSTG